MNIYKTVLHIFNGWHNECLLECAEEEKGCALIFCPGRKGRNVKDFLYTENIHGKTHTAHTFIISFFEHLYQY